MDHRNSTEVQETQEEITKQSGWEEAECQPKSPPEMMGSQGAFLTDEWDAEQRGSKIFSDLFLPLEFVITIPSELYGPRKHKNAYPLTGVREVIKNSPKVQTCPETSCF